MPPKKAIQPVAQHGESPEKGAFWDTESSNTHTPHIEEKRNLSEHISRLQQRQMELVQQTTLELEELKRQVEESREYDDKLAAATAPLQGEIAELRRTIQLLEQEKRTLNQDLNQAQQTFQAQYNQIQGAINSLKNSIRGQASAFDQQIRVFNLDATQSLESMLSTLNNAEISLTNLPQPKTPSEEKVLAPVSFEEHAAHLAEEHGERTQKAVKPERKKATFPISRKFAIRAVSMAIIAGVGTWGAGIIRSRQTSEVGQVAGVSTTQFSSDPSLNMDHPESYADVPFAETQWMSLADSDLNMSMLYPKNTTNRVRVVGSDNIFFPRKDHILAKISKEETNATLDQWWSVTSSLYPTSDYTVAKGTLKGKQAYILTPTFEDTTSGTYYFVKSGNQIITLWLYAEKSDSDDMQRLEKMLSSIQFPN